MTRSKLSGVESKLPVVTNRDSVTYSGKQQKLFICFITSFTALLFLTNIATQVANLDVSSRSTDHETGATQTWSESVIFGNEPNDVTGLTWNASELKLRMETVPSRILGWPCMRRCGVVSADYHARLIWAIAAIATPTFDLNRYCHGVHFHMPT